MQRILHDRETAVEIDAYFNGFHDGFIRSLTLRSGDRFVAYGPSVTEIGHEISGELSVEFEIAHYNYDQGRQAYDRVVRARFFDVAQFHLDLRPVKAVEWPITSLEFHPEPEEPLRFRLVLTLGRFENDEWSTRQFDLFTFSRAEFIEGR